MDRILTGITIALRTIQLIITVVQSIASLGVDKVLTPVSSFITQRTAKVLTKSIASQVLGSLKFAAIGIIASILIDYFLEDNATVNAGANISLLGLVVTTFSVIGMYWLKGKFAGTDMAILAKNKLFAELFGLKLSLFGMFLGAIFHSNLLLSAISFALSIIGIGITIFYNSLEDYVISVPWNLLEEIISGVSLGFTTYILFNNIAELSD